MKINWLAELERMARGQKTKADPRVIAMCAIPWVKAGLATDEIEQLERLYRLKDPRA